MILHKKPISDIEAIVIGGSWGGMDAIIQLVSGMPGLYPIPLIAVIHRQRNSSSSLPKVISKYTSLGVKEVDEKERILPGTLYLAPPNYHVLIEEDKTFALDVSEDVHYARPAIDILFESAAMVFKNKLVGILLTGANTDGSDGLAAIDQMGGVTIVQDPVEAQMNTMPKSAMAKMKVDYVLTIKEIQEYLLKLAK